MNRNEFTELMKTVSLWRIFAVALLVRLALLVFLHDSYYTAGMAQGELARNLVEGRGFVINEPFAAEVGRMQDSLRQLIDVENALAVVAPDDSPENLHPFIAYMMPGQGILLAGTYFLTGEYRYIYLQTIQAIADSFGVFLIFWLGMTLFGRKTAFLGAILFSLYVPEARLAISATRDAWMPLVYLGSACAVGAAWKRPSPSTYLILGSVVSVGAYFRSEILLLPLFYLFIRFLLRRNLREHVKPAILVLLPIVLLLTPWTIRNAVVFERIIPTNSGLWLAMWQSFGEYENDFGAVNNDRITFEQTRQWGYTAEFDSPEYDDIFRERVLNVIMESPGWTAWTIVRRVFRIPFQMHSWGIPQTEDLTSANEVYSVGRADVGTYWDYITKEPSRFVAHAVARLVTFALYLSVAAWFFSVGRNSRQEGLILLAVPLYNILIHAVIGVHARYILPTNGILLLFAASFFASRFRSRGSETS